MVAKITVPGSIGRALNYNEQKVQQGKATCLMASGFLKEAADLNFYEKLSRFEALIQLNKRASTNTAHISLNFAEGEKLAEEKLKEIASLYMEKIGFGHQPFLVYEHRDAGHPHLHLVTTNIRRDGSRISLHNLGRDGSEKARKELEVQFGLTKATERKKQASEQFNLSPAQKAVYGKVPTKRAITTVLDAVLPRYKYASLAELNAVLRRYHVLADRGAENGVIYRTGGLVYRILDEEGKKVGVPVKASTLYSKPTLANLEKRFSENSPQKEQFKKGLQTAIDWIMIQPPASLSLFEKALQKENISLVIRQNTEGFVYGLTYIDHRSKCVFNGSELGKAYSAKGVLEKCGIRQSPQKEQSLAEKPSRHAPAKHASQAEGKWNKDSALAILDGLLRAEQEPLAVPYPLKKQKNKQRKL